MGKKIRTVIGASVMAGAVMAMPATAQAAPAGQPPSAKTRIQQADSSVDIMAKGYKRCPKGYFCLFTGKNGKGVIAKFKKGSDDLRKFGMNDNTRSAWNRTSKKVKAYSGLARHGYLGYFSPGGQGMKKKAWNKISSIKVG